MRYLLILLVIIFGSCTTTKTVSDVTTKTIDRVLSDTTITFTFAKIQKIDTTNLDKLKRGDIITHKSKGITTSLKLKDNNIITSTTVDEQKQEAKLQKEKVTIKETQTIIQEKQDNPIVKALKWAWSAADNIVVLLILVLIVIFIILRKMKLI